MCYPVRSVPYSVLGWLQHHGKKSHEKKKERKNERKKDLKIGSFFKSWHIGLFLWEVQRQRIQLIEIDLNAIV